MFFRIPYPCKYSDIRKALFKFVLVLEKIGFRNNGAIDFNWMESVNENEYAFAEYRASAQVERMEEEESAHGSDIDLSQAKQALENILRSGS